MLFWCSYRETPLNKNKGDIGHALCLHVYHSPFVENSQKCKTYSKTKYIKLNVSKIRRI